MLDGCFLPGWPSCKSQWDSSDREAADTRAQPSGHQEAGAGWSPPINTPIGSTNVLKKSFCYSMDLKQCRYFFCSGYGTENENA